jgi:cytochrome c oxidase cbb3-type subunit 3
MTDQGPDTGHEYDGIREHDNRLPRWWLLTLYGAIGFSFAYWLAYHAFDALPQPREELAAEMAVRASEAKAREANNPVSNESLLAATKDAAVVAAGQAVYTSTCLACHGPTGGGLVGPNLTDAFYVHGAQPVDTLRIIKDGSLQKGMPAWGPVLGDEKTRAAAVFVLTLRNTNAAGGKAPEGKDEAGNAAPAASAPPALTAPTNAG